MTSTKPYCIAKRTVWEAYQQVKANRGAAGIDDETIAMFEQNLSRNLYKLWNRMSSGSYFPPPVKQVEIPKAKGGTRTLGIPTVSDRIAQTVVKRIIEPTLDPIFHPDSYGYRPGRSAKQAIAVTRKRCWQYDWVVEFDIKAAFDQIDHGLLLKAVRTHIREGWILRIRLSNAPCCTTGCVTQTDTFGVRYHPDHIGRLMHTLGWTPQKPERRALERDEEEIERWKQEDWPRIKKTPQGWAPISSSPMNRASC